MRARSTVAIAVVVAQLAVICVIAAGGQPAAAQQPPAPAGIDTYAIAADGTGATALDWGGSDNVTTGPAASGGGIRVAGKRNRFDSQVTYATTLNATATTVFATPGQDIGAALDTRVNAIAANPSRILQRYSSVAETTARKGIRQGWGVGQPGCTGVDLTAAQASYGTASLRCDEFPNFSMQDAGPGAYLKYVPSTDNAREGARYGTFVNAPVCTQRVKLPAYAEREQFAVIPVGLPITFFTCGLRLG